MLADVLSLPPHPVAPPLVARTLPEAAALDHLRAAVCDFEALDTTPAPAGTRLLHATARSLHATAMALMQCEAAGHDRAALLPLLARLRDLNARSPFVHRLQTWPRGYPGDFETVEWICDARNRATPGSLGWAIEECSLQSPVAQQHRNKVSVQADTVHRTITARPAARILSIGCGGCRDLRLVIDRTPIGAAEFVLVDADSDALRFAADRLTMVGRQCHYVAGRVPRVLRQVQRWGPFDLVVAGGLFDYLPDRWAVQTLRGIHHVLQPGGRLLFSNMATGNPFRPWIEYLAEWFLIERTAADLRTLLDASGFDGLGADVTSETTGLAHLVNVVV